MDVSTGEYLLRHWLSDALDRDDRDSAIEVSRSLRYWAHRLNLADPGDVDRDLASWDLPDLVALRSALRRNRHVLRPLDSWRSVGASLALRIATDPALAGFTAQADSVLGDALLTPVWPLPDIWLAEFFRELHHPTELSACAFTPDGSALITAGGGRILLWDVDSGTLQHAYPHAHTEEPAAEAAEIARLCVAPDGRWLGTMHTPGQLATRMGRPGALRIWDLPTLRPRHLLADDAESLMDCGTDSAGRLFVSYHLDRVVRCWDPISGAVSRHAG